MRPTGHSSIPLTCPTSPMAARLLRRPEGDILKRTAPKEASKSGPLRPAQPGITDPSQRQGACNPHQDDCHHSGSAGWTLRGLVRPGAALSHDLVGNERHHEPDAEGEDDQLAEPANEGCEVRKQ